ncbi:MAG: EAL domain-containing protein [Candidatus Thiodiazotropha endolucinida]
MKKQITSDELQAQLNLKLLERLRTSERRYRELVSNLKQIVFQLDRDGRMTFLNLAWENITGTSIDTAVHLPLSHFLPEADRTEFDAIVHQLLIGSGQIFSFESELIGENDIHTPVEMTLTPQLEISDVTGIVGTIIDVTEHKDMLRELSLNRERLFFALQGANDGYWDWNLETDEVYYSPRWKSMLGYRDDELQENDLTVWEQLVHPDDRGTTLKQVRRYLDGHIDKFEVEFRMQHKAGHWVNILSRASLACDDNSRPLSPKRLVGTHVDVTERKQIEQKLLKQNLALEATANAIFITDPDGEIEWANQAFLKMSGYNMEEVLGHNPKQLIYSGKQENDFYENLWQSISSGQVWQGDLINRKKDGSLFDVCMTITPVLDVQGQITNYIAVKDDITHRKQIEKEVEELAFYDPLTRLPNRRLFMSHLKQAILHSRRQLTYSALLFIDLDHFKNLNDSYGHDIGDLLLIEVASRITSCLREVDLVARLGGDEFVVILENMGKDSAEINSSVLTICEKILASVSAESNLKNISYSSTCSIGVCLFRDEYPRAEDILKRADTAMYEAKKSGRNSVHFFNPEMQQELKSRLQLERELAYALTQNQFRLFYQLIVDHERNVVGAEALLRWHHPDKGIIGPNQLFPLIELNGMIIPIGEWVINEGIHQLQRWQKEGSTRSLTLSVNISALQFKKPDFISNLASSIDKYGIDCNQLYLELTESTLIINFSSTNEKIEKLNRMGIKTSLDDFGTGYSSLSYLKRFNVSQLKIDRSFVHDILVDEGDLTMVRTIIEMGRNLGLEVVAEGVSNEQQFELLKSCGCKLFQGYWINRPLPIEDIDSLLSPLSHRSSAF